LITSRSGKLRLNLSDSNEVGNQKGSPAETVSRPFNDEVLTVAEMREFEANNIRKALEQAGGKISGAGGAAELLEMKPTTLASRIKSLGI